MTISQAHRAGRLRVVGTGRIAVACGASTEIVEWDEVVTIRSVHNCTQILTRTRSLKIRSPLSAVVTQLSGVGLVQVRRDAAVNGSKVRQLVGSGCHRLAILLDDGSSLEVGRRFQRVVRLRFGAGSRCRGERNRRETETVLAVDER